MHQADAALGGTENRSTSPMGETAKLLEGVYGERGILSDLEGTGTMASASWLKDFE